MAKVSQAEVEAALGNGIDSPEVATETKKEETKKEEKKPEEDEEEEEEEEEKTETKKTEEEKKSTEKKVDDSKEKKEDKKDEKPADDKKDEKKSDENKSDEETSIKDEVIAKAFEEKYDISNYKDLVETLEGVDALMDEHDKLVEENKKLKEAKPELKFESEGQKKVFEFLTKTGYDPSKLGDGIMTHAKLVSMDLGKDADPRMILEERYVIEHPELTRAEAQKKFSRDYDRKFVVDKSKFENEEEYKEEQELADIEKKSAVAKAVDFLKKKQEEFKPSDEGGKKEPTEVKISKEVESGIKKTVADFRNYMEGLETVTFTDEKNPNNTFTYSVPKKVQKQVLEAGTNYLSKADLYNEKGEISGKYEPEDYALNVTMSLIWKDVVEKMLRSVDQKAAIINVEKKAEKKPTRDGKEKGDPEDLDFMQAAEIEADSRLKRRKQMSGR